MVDFNPYNVLGVSPGTDEENIKRAYRRLAQRLHPDVNPNHPGAVAQFQDITAAYQLLIDPMARRRYDEDEQRALDQNTDNRDSYFTLRVTPSKRALVPLPEEQVIYILAEIAADPHIKREDVSKERANLNLTLVLDRSNSMRGTRIERVKIAAQRLISKLMPTDIISIIDFNDRASVIIPATPVKDKNALAAMVSMIKPGGGTEIFHGLSEGVKQNRTYLAPRMINHIILLTDGHTFGDQEQCIELAKEAARDGISISAMGLGTDWNDDFLDELASSTGGASTYIKSAGAVTNFFDAQIKSLVNAFAERMSLSIAPDPDIVPEMAFQLSPSPQEVTLNDDGRIPLSSLQPQRPIKLLLQFQLPPDMKEGFRTISRIVANGDILQNRKQAYKAISDISLEVTPDPPREEPPPAIMDALSKLTLYRMQERAKEALDEGNVTEATRRLENLATRLLEIGESNLAQQTLVEAENISQTHMLSAKGQKTIKYQTRALLAEGGLEQALSTLLTSPDE